MNIHAVTWFKLYITSSTKAVYIANYLNNIVLIMDSRYGPVTTQLILCITAILWIGLVVLSTRAWHCRFVLNEPAVMLHIAACFQWLLGPLTLDPAMTRPYHLHRLFA